MPYSLIIRGGKHTLAQYLQSGRIIGRRISYSRTGSQINVSSSKAIASRDAE